MRALGPRLAALALVAVLAASALAGEALDRARALEAEGDLAAAADAYLAAWKDAPDSKEAGMGLAHAVLGAKRKDLYRQTEMTLAGLLHATPDDADLGRALGEVLLVQALDAASPNLAKALALRARAHLQPAVEARPDDATAIVLLARAIDRAGEADAAVQAIDAWLADGRKAPPALVYEKGRILYDDALRRHAEAGGTYPLPDEVFRDLARARDLFYAATVADPSDFEAWLHLAWAAHRIGEYEDARLGYERALLLDPKSALPLRGLQALLAHEPGAFEEAMQRLVTKHPEAGKVFVFQAWQKVQTGELEEAQRLLDLADAEHAGDADGLYLLGKLHTLGGRPEDAEPYYWRALEADPRHLLAAEAIDQTIRASALAMAKQDRAGLSTVLERYERLVEAAPENPYVRNNVGFLLREAWSAHRDDPEWRDVLDLSAQHYDAAVEIVGRWSAERARGIPFARRYALAQIVCDAGVLRQNFEPIVDPVRAEYCFRQSLLWSDWGYLDSWTYLAKLLEQQGRWKELHEVALRCAEGLVSEKEEPLAAEREKARQKAHQLEVDGRLDGAGG